MLFRCLLILGLLLATPALALDNGVARTPPMGWNSYSTCNVQPSERVIREVADALVNSGLRDAGYVYVCIDDGWLDSPLEVDGRMKPVAAFPNGIKPLADYLHGQGLKLGLYHTVKGSVAGRQPGIGPNRPQHAQLHAQQMADWGVDFVKLDFLSQTSDVLLFRDALQRTGRPIVLSLSYFAGTPGMQWQANLWRTNRDTSGSYEAIRKSIDTVVGKEFFAGPGGWNDPDVLQVGVRYGGVDAKGRPTGMTLDENVTHFSLWCMAAAPLVVGADIRRLPPEIRAVLCNKEAIAINQDPLGLQGFPVVQAPDRQIWSRRLADGVAVLLWNTSETPRDISVNWQELFLQPGKMQVRDLWQHADLGEFTTRFTAEKVPPHGVRMLKLTGGVPLAPRRVMPLHEGVKLAMDVRGEQTWKGPWGEFTFTPRLRNMDGSYWENAFYQGAGRYGVVWLNGQYRRFEAIAGVLPKNTPRGHVEIWGDAGKVLFRSAPMTANTRPLPLQVDVTGQHWMAILFVEDTGGNRTEFLLSNACLVTDAAPADWPPRAAATGPAPEPEADYSWLWYYVGLPLGGGLLLVLLVVWWAWSVRRAASRSRR